MPVIGEEAAIDKVANKRGTTRTGQIRQWIEEGLEAAAEGMTPRQHLELVVRPNLSIVCNQGR